MQIAQLVLPSQKLGANPPLLPSRKGLNNKEGLTVGALIESKVLIPLVGSLSYELFMKTKS